MGKVRTFIDHGASPTFMRIFNFWAMAFFILLIPVSVLYLANSVPYLVAISVWANIAGHLSAWQSSRVEERQEES
jgi:heme/copper-type cytochrome/quinol oxidase subunit 1